MPWAPELFSAPVLERIKEERRESHLHTVPYFDGLLAGEPEALVESFAGEPELHHPIRGRIKGTRAFRAYVDDMNGWSIKANLVVGDIVEHGVIGAGGFEEVEVQLDGRGGRIALPFALVGEHEPDGRLRELRLYFSSWALTGRHAVRPPLLQRDPRLRESDVVGDYQRALGAGDVDAIAATFEPDAYAREPAGGDYVHRGADELREFYELLFSNEGGIPLQHCMAFDDGRVCALEYNVVQWGKTELPPQAGLAVYVRGESGRLAAARIYDDVDPPLRSGT